MNSINSQLLCNIKLSEPHYSQQVNCVDSHKTTHICEVCINQWRTLDNAMNQASHCYNSNFYESPFILVSKIYNYNYVYCVISPLMENLHQVQSKKSLKTSIFLPQRVMVICLILCILQVQENGTWNEVVHWKEYMYVPAVLCTYMC